MSVALTKWIHVEMWKVFLATLPSDKIIMGNAFLFLFFFFFFNRACQKTDAVYTRVASLVSWHSRRNVS